MHMVHNTYIIACNKMAMIGGYNFVRVWPCIKEYNQTIIVLEGGEWMSRNLGALLIKFIVIGLVSVIILPIFGRFTSGQAILIALVLTLVGYFLGDLSILPRLSRSADITAILIDAVTAIVIIGVADFAFNGFITLNAAGWVLFLALLAVEEWFFHRYLTPTPTPAPVTGEPGEQQE